MTKNSTFILTLIISIFLISGTVCFADVYSDIIYNTNKASTTNSATNIIKGYCNGDGVKFKASPGANGTTLGLCYKNETLYKQATPAGTPLSWIYVYRPKTDQYGYIAAQYFSLSITPNSI